MVCRVLTLAPRTFLIIPFPGNESEGMATLQRLVRVPWRAPAIEKAAACGSERFGRCPEEWRVDKSDIDEYEPLASLTPRVHRRFNPSVAFSVYTKYTADIELQYND